MSHGLKVQILVETRGPEWVRSLKKIAGTSFFFF